MSEARFAPGRFIRSTSVRQALVLILVFAVVNLATLGGAYFKMRGDLLETVRSELGREVAGYDLSATPRALAAIVGAKARATDPRDTVMVYMSPDGSQVGNAHAEVEGQGVHLTPLEGGPALTEAGYAHEIRGLSGGMLIVGVSLARVEGLRETYVNLLLLSLVPTVLVSLALAAVIARRNARRAGRVEAVLERLSAGDLAARVSGEDGADDDLARIATGVNHMARRQEAATEALRQVSSDIAHDLRTPLQRISVLLHDLRGRLEDGTDAADLAERAEAEAEGAVTVFQALLQIAQIEGKGNSFELKRVDLREPARRMFELFQPAVEDAGSTLVYSEPEGPVEIDGNEGLIAQAVVNLVENAMRHTPAGSHILVSVVGGPEGARLVVADDGPGIPAEEYQNVQRRLYRLERSRTTPGHGLGLSLVAAIAELHGGRLDLGDNAPGLRAEVVFPAAAAQR